MIHRGKTLSPFRKVGEEGIKEGSLVLFLEVIKRKVKEDPKYSQPQFQETINALMDYGFSREEVIDALRAANDDRDLALQYLEEGIPEEGAELGPGQN